MRDRGIAVHCGFRAHGGLLLSTVFGDHFHGVTWTLLDADGAAGASCVVDLVALSGPGFVDGVFGTSSKAVIALETVAAGQATFGLVQCLRLAQPRHDFLEATG